MVYFYCRFRSKYFPFFLINLRKESRKTPEEIVKNEVKKYLLLLTFKSYDSYGLKALKKPLKLLFNIFIFNL